VHFIYLFFVLFACVGAAGHHIVAKLDEGLGQQCQGQNTIKMKYWQVLLLRLSFQENTTFS
jgi:hypothetical protein